MPLNRFLFLVFFISGFCGLLYQIIWLRMAFAAFGIITPVISVIVSVFMLGLSIGSWLGGKWVESAAARSGRSAITYYGIIEFIIGIGAFLVPLLFSIGENALLSLGEADSTRYLLFSAAAITVAILPWCICMGATFPTMMAFVRELEQGQKESFSFLYVANVLGAACGAAVTALVLVEIMGFSGTLYLGAGFNLSISVAALLMGREYAGVRRAETSSATAERPAPLPGAPSAMLTVAVLFVTGFSSMALEVVWTRAFTPVMHTTIYAFAALLVTYLVATWIGSVRYRKHLRRNEVMPLGQVMGYLAVSAFLPIVLNDADFRPHPFVVCLSIMPLCGFLGYLTPHLIDAYSAGHPEHAGKVYAVNILGCILGPLFAGYMILPSMGTKGAMILLGAPFVVLFFITYKTWTTDALQRLLCAVGAVALFLISAGWTKGLEDATLDPGAVVRRDHTATVLCEGKGMNRMLYVNGIGITKMTTICKVMAHWPAVHLPEKPKNVLVICFGMGTTYRSAMRWDADVTAVELVPSVRDVFGFFHADAEALLANPKGRVIIDDGRRFLKRTTQKFDIISIDPPPPVEAAGSSLLYSKEMYDLIKMRLSEDGILQQWFPKGDVSSGQAAGRAIAQSFPYVRSWIGIEGWGLHFLASMKPLPVMKVEEIIAKMPPAVQADLVEWYPPQVDAKKAIERLVTQEFSMKEIVHPEPSVVITDDRPFNEYYVLRRYFGYPLGATLAPTIVAIIACGLIVALVCYRPRKAPPSP